MAVQVLIFNHIISVGLVIIREVKEDRSDERVTIHSLSEEESLSVLDQHVLESHETASHDGGFPEFTSPIGVSSFRLPNSSHLLTKFS